MNRVASLLLFGSLLFAGCSHQASSDPVVGVEDDDARMTAAMDKARETFPLFLKHWQSMPSDATSVKIAVPTADDSLEHIWFAPVSIADNKITATCGNDPANVPDLKYGDERTFELSDVSDWMIMSGKTCYGGYTVRVLSEMEPENAPPLEFAELE